MKVNRLIALMLALFISVVLTAQDKKEQTKKKKTGKVTFLVSMHCENCKAKIEKNISWEKGVKDLSVRFGEQNRCGYLQFGKYDGRKTENRD